MSFILKKLINGSVEINNTQTGEISVLLPNKNIFLYNRQILNNNILYVKISIESNFNLQTLGINIPYDKIDFTNCVPPITPTTPESVLEQLGTNFFFY
jgi:hypothetical protein